MGQALAERGGLEGSEGARLGRAGGTRLVQLGQELLGADGLLVLDLDLVLLRLHAAHRGEVEATDLCGLPTAANTAPKIVPATSP